MEIRCRRLSHDGFFWYYWQTKWDNWIRSKYCTFRQGKKRRLPLSGWFTDIFFYQKSYLLPKKAFYCQWSSYSENPVHHSVFNNINVGFFHNTWFGDREGLFKSFQRYFYVEQICYESPSFITSIGNWQIIVRKSLPCKWSSYQLYRFRKFCSHSAFFEHT